MKILLSERIQKQRERDPVLRPATLDKDYYCLKNLAPKPEPVNKI